MDFTPNTSRVEHFVSSGSKELRDALLFITKYGVQLLRLIEEIHSRIVHITTVFGHPNYEHSY